MPSRPQKQATGNRKPATGNRARKSAPAKKAAPAPAKKAPVKKTKTAATKPSPTKKPAAKTKHAATKKSPTRKAPAAKKKRAAKAKSSTTTKRATATKRAAKAKPVAPKPIVATPVAKGGLVVEILEADQPVEALRRYIAGIGEVATVQEGQVVLGSAQLMLFPAARDERGSHEVKAILDLVLSVWHALPDQVGFHANEFLRNAFAGVGDDPERIARLLAVVPEDPSPELLFNIACAHAFTGNRAAMIDAVRAALAAGVTASQLRRDDDLAPYLDDPQLVALLEGARTPVISVDVAPYVPAVRAALDGVIRTLERLGVPPRLEPPATLDEVLAMESDTSIQLPNDLRALLTIADGMELWEKQFFGRRDYRSETPLSDRARNYLELSAGYGAIGIDECVPVANWGQPNDWLLYDPRGVVRGGEPGYILMLNADENPQEDLVTVLAGLAVNASDVLGVN